MYLQHDVKALAESILVHRVVLSTDAELSDRSPREVIAGVLGEFRLVEPPIRETGKEGVERGGDALLLKEMEDAAGILQAGLLGVLLLCRVLPR